MKNNKKNKLGYSFSITITICLIILFLFYQNLYFPNGTILYNSGNSSSNQKTFDHPQYDSIINLQTAFISNAKLVGPSVVNLSKIQLKKIFNNSNNSFYDSSSFFTSLLKLFDGHISRKEFPSETIGSGVIITNK